MTPLQWVSLFAEAAGVAMEVVDRFVDEHPELREPPEPLNDEIERKHARRLEEMHALHRSRFEPDADTIPSPPDTDPGPSPYDD